jgi:hypothetical protein
MTSHPCLCLHRAGKENWKNYYLHVAFGNGPNVCKTTRLFKMALLRSVNRFVRINSGNHEPPSVRTIWPKVSCTELCRDIPKAFKNGILLKVKLFLYLSKYRAMRTYGGLDECEWSASRIGMFTAGGVPSTHWIGGGMDGWWRERNPFFTTTGNRIPFLGPVA